MKYFRAFVAGTVFPTLFLPIMVCIAVASGKSQILLQPFIHWLPVIWGLWNLLFFYGRNLLPQNENVALSLAGAVLGLLVALFAVFWLHIPKILGIESYFFIPLILAPIVYALLWRYVVKPINKIIVG